MANAIRPARRIVPRVMGTSSLNLSPGAGRTHGVPFGIRINIGHGTNRERRRWLRHQERHECRPTPARCCRSSWAAARARGCSRSPRSAPSRPCRWRASTGSSTSPSRTASTRTCRRIYLLTQFNSASLHRHMSQSYKFDHFSGGLRRDSRRGADVHRHLVVSGHGRRRAQEPGALPQSRFRLRADPERRPALPDGLPPHHRAAHRVAGRADHRHDSGDRREASRLGHHADRSRSAASRASWRSRRTPRCRTA